MKTEARIAAGLLVLGVALTTTVAGCRSSSGMSERSAGSSSYSSVSTGAQGAEASAAPEEDQTATETATETQAAPPESAAPSSILRPDAPKSYVVKRGDTLWDIASMFLKDPWLWPEVWIINPQVENPHLIYPGDTLALAFGANGKPQIGLQSGGAARLNPRLRTSPLDGAIPTLPYSSIAAFLSRPTVLSKDQVKEAPYVLAFREKHIIGGSGNELYVKDLKAPENTRFAVVHIGEELRDPDDGAVVGYEGIYTGTAAVVKANDVSKAVLMDTARETLVGDRLIQADTQTPLNFVLSAPPANLQGRIISVVDGTELIGQYQVVVINRGKRHGIVAGNVMAVDQAGDIVRDRGGDYGEKSGLRVGGLSQKKVRLPDERAGTLLVFRTFDRISYGLIVGASTEIHVADYVRNP
ncbi:MAG TPA: LysM peptidoglycan-binding domain-containing protein [Steroidobacteraceae bacterium]|jgi:LysM repeat protein